MRNSLHEVAIRARLASVMAKLVSVCQRFIATTQPSPTRRQLRSTTKRFFDRRLLSALSRSGANAPFGVWTLRATYGHVDRSGGPVDGQKADQFAIGGVYDLSKRTAFYGTYSYLKNKDGASFTVSPLINVAAGGALDKNSTGFEVGIKHSF